MSIQCNNSKYKHVYIYSNYYWSYGDCYLGFNFSGKSLKIHGLAQSTLKLSVYIDNELVSTVTNFSGDLDIPIRGMQKDHSCKLVWVGREGANWYAQLVSVTIDDTELLKSYDDTIIPVKGYHMYKETLTNKRYAYINK